MTRWLPPRFGETGLVVWLAPAKPNDAEQRLREWDVALKHQCVTRKEFRRSVLNLDDMPGGDSPPEPTPQPANRNGRLTDAIVRR